MAWTHSAYERGFEVSIQALIVLAISPCDAAWRLGAPSTLPPDAPDFRWPVVLIRFSLAQIYLIAGWSKLARVGPQWATSDNLRRWLVLFSESDISVVFNSLGPWIAAHPALCGVVAVGALALDLSFVLAVFSRRARMVLVPAALAMHAGIALSMNIVFLNAPQLLVFCDFDAVARRFRRQSITTS